MVAFGIPTLYFAAFVRLSKETPSGSVTMLSGVIRRALAVTVCSFAVSTAAAAQLRVEVGATIGRYSPLGSFQQGMTLSSSLPRQASDLSGTSYGGQLRMWVAPRVGFEFSASTSSSTVGGGSTPVGISPTTTARVSTGSAQLLFLLTRSQSRASVWLGAGGGVVEHGGQTYKPFGTQVDGAGVFSVASAFRIKGGLSADLGVTSLIYYLDAQNMPPSSDNLLERGRQFDVLLRTGLSYRLH